MKLRVLHIANWYPTPDRPKAYPFIPEHLNALAPFVEQDIVHVDLRQGPFKFYGGRESTPAGRLKRHVWQLPLKQWRLIELLSGVLLAFVLLFKVRARRYDVVNVHIAYPLLTYWHWIKRFAPRKVVITEHWSAYHLNFNLPPETPLPRIKHIFAQGMPVLTVSKALGEDVARFAGRDDFARHVVPNVVDPAVYNYNAEATTEPYTLFMVSGWKAPKDPFVVLRAIAQLHNQYPKWKLRIGGYGPQEAEIKALVKELGLVHMVTWLGPMEKPAIAREMNRAGAFLHGSGYETFSVVVAEALCCGTPVLASAVGGIVELVRPHSGELVTENTVAAWTVGLQKLMQRLDGFDRAATAAESAGRFSPQAVGQAYAGVLRQEAGLPEPA